jgi:alkyl hydroperoxide reductase subunit AhpC
MESAMANPDRPQVGVPRIGSPAPQFEATTTHGVLRLEDFKGGWLVLFSHPADFTPVCTTEFMGFADIHPKLREMNVELLGLSIDSVYSHIAWARNIEEKLGKKITFPIIADLNKEVATLYGMIMPGESKTETSRCVFVIDDKQIIRAIIYYPLSTGPGAPDDGPARRRHPGQLAPGRQGHRLAAQDAGRRRGKDQGEGRGLQGLVLLQEGSQIRRGHGLHQRRRHHFHHGQVAPEEPGKPALP